MNGRKWSDLPSELLCKIAKLLIISDRMDIRRLRAVCSSWRSSVPSPKYFPAIKIPVPNHISSSSESNTPYILKERTLLLVSPLLIAVNDNNSDEISGHSSSAPWIIQVEETSPNKWLLHDPLVAKIHEKTFTNCSDQLPDSINLLDFKVVEISRSFDFYHREVATFFFPMVRKAIVQRDGNEINDENFTLYVLFYNETSIAFWKPGAECWNPLEIKCDGPQTIVDIINHKGDVYALLKGGTLMKVNNESYEMMEVATKPLLETCSYHYKYNWYLVEFHECLYLLAYYVEEAFFLIFDHKVFVLNKMNGSWDIANDLGGAAFFVVQDAVFSVSAKDIGLPQGSNVLYFDGYVCYNSETESEQVCSLKCNLHSKFTLINKWWPDRSPFWPPPNWIKQLQCHS